MISFHLIEPNKNPIVNIKGRDLLLNSRIFEPEFQRSGRSLEMLNNQRTHSSPIAGLVMEASRGSAISSVLTNLMHRVVIAFEKASERRKCRKLIRDTKREMAKLDDNVLRDIGWPGRYEQQNPCAREDF